jgi:hypothetical protein
MLFKAIVCPSCQSTDIVKHGPSGEGKERYRYRNTAIPNSNGNIRYRRYLAFMVSREISLISDVFCASSSNLSLLESQQPANKLDQSLNRALR